MDEPLSPTTPGGPGVRASTSPGTEAVSNAEETAAALLDGTRALSPRRRHRAEAEEAAAASPDMEILLLTGRLQELIARRREEETQRSAAPVSTRLRPSVQRPVAPLEEEAAAALAAARAELPTMEARRRFGGPTAEERLAAAAIRWGRLGGWLLALLALPVAAFFIGRLTAPAPAQPSPEQLQATGAAAKLQPAGAPNAPATDAPRWTPATLARLEEVFTLLHDGGDTVRPTALLRELRGANGPLPGLDLLITEMDLRSGNAQDATSRLLPLYRANPPVAPACDELGFLSARGRRLDEATNYFAAAAEADPLSGLYFYHWGEGLRRQGKVEEAITRLEQALRRHGTFGGARPAPPGTPLRLSLARLEAGHGAEVRRQTEDLLKKLPPGTPEMGQMLMALAATDLQDGRYAEAGARLGQARDMLASTRSAGGAPEFDVLLNDYFFRAFTTRPELANVIPPATSEAEARRVAGLNGSAEVYFIDP